MPSHTSYPHLPTTSGVPITIPSLHLTHPHQPSPSLHPRAPRPLKRSSLSRKSPTRSPPPSQPFASLDDYRAQSPPSFTLPAPHPTHASHAPHPSHYPSPPSHPPPSASPALQSSYISNLQQQVYFLELELNLLKSSPSTLPSSSDPDAPLDSLVTSLREKFVTQSSQHQSTLSTLRSEHAAATEQLHLAMLEKDRLTLDLTSLTSKLSDLKTRERDQRARAALLERRLQDVEAASEAKAKEAGLKVKGLEDELRALCISNQTLADDHRTVLHDRDERETALTSKAADLSDRLHAQQVKTLELEHREKALPYHSLREEIDRLKTAARDHQRQLREAELQAEERAEAVRVLGEQRAAVLEENAQLQHRLHVYEAEVNEHATQMSLHHEGANRWSEVVTSSQREHATAREEVAVLSDRLARVKAQWRETKEERATLAHTLKEWETNIATQHSQHSALQSEHSTLQAQHAQLQVTCQLLRDDAAALTAQLQEVQGRYEAGEDARRRLQVRVEGMQREAEVNGALAGLNVEGLRGVMGGWEAMAEVMKGVVGKIEKREEEKEREGGTIQPLNAGELESARSGVSAIYGTPAGGRGGRAEVGSESEEEGEEGSEEEEKEEEEWGSRPSTGSSSMPLSARSQASESSVSSSSSASSSLSSSSYTSTASRANDVRRRETPEKGGRDRKALPLRRGDADRRPEKRPSSRERRSADSRATVPSRR